MSSENTNNPSPGGPERRAAPRYPTSQKVVCYPAGAGLSERRQMRLRNASRNGFAVITDRRWEAGTAVVLELPSEEGTTMTRGRVVHSTPQLGGCFLIGCVLDHALTDAQLQALTS